MIAGAYSASSIPFQVLKETPVEYVPGELEGLQTVSCQNAISKGPFSHRGHKGTAEEDIRLRPIFPSSAGIYQPD